MGIERDNGAEVIREAGAQHRIREGAALRAPQLAVLHRAGLAFNATLELSEVLRRVLDQVRVAVPATCSAIWLLDPRTQDLVCQGAVGRQDTGADAPYVPSDPCPAEQRAVSQALEQDRTLYISDATVGLDTYGAPEAVGSLLCAPLRLGSPRLGSLAINGAIGVIVATHPETHAFQPDHATLLDALAASAAIAIENARLYTQAQRDLGEQAQVERALRHSQTYYRTLIETSPAGIVVADLDGTITMCNQRVLELHGYTCPSEVLGAHFLTLIAPEDRADTLADRQRILTGKPVREKARAMLRADGAIFAGEIAASLIPDEHGQPAGTVAFIQDVSDRLEAENAIRRHNYELRVLNRVATDISQAHDLRQLLGIALDRALEAMDATAGWVTLFAASDTGDGAKPEILLQRGELHIEAAHGSGADLRRWLERTALSTQRPVHVTAAEVVEALNAAPGREVAGVPLMTNGTVDGFLAVVGEIDRQPKPLPPERIQLLSAVVHQISVAIENARLSAKAAEATLLRELDQMRSQLVASFSHDLRTPLGLIKMACSTLQRSDVDLDECARREFLLDIETQADRLSRLVDGILDLEQLQNGHLTLHRVEFDVAEMLERVARETDRAHVRHQVKAKLEAPVRVWADPVRVEQVIHNLLDNAIKYTPNSGRIVVRARLDAQDGERQHKALIWIEDTGIGIPNEELDLIFERFYRVDNETTGEINGAGLGLATCKGIVEAHGGTIWTESSLGRGSTFYFTLPTPPRLPGRRA